jgi:hypothetical protein
VREGINVSQGRGILSAKGRKYCQPREGNMVSQGIKTKRKRKAEYCDPIFG